MNPASPLRSESQTILMVHDAPACLADMVNFLQEHDFKVEIARSGKEGFERVQGVKPDIILLNALMPEMDGYEICRRFKKNEYAWDIPVILIMAEGDDRAAGFEAGAVDYIAQPLQTEEVLVRINTHLTLRRLQKLLISKNAQLQQEIAIRQQAEAALQRSASENVALYNNASCGYHSLAKNGVFVQINDMELKWLGRERDEVIGKMLFADVLTPKSLEAAHEYFPQIREQDWLCDFHDFEFEIVHKNGTVMPILLSAKTVKVGNDALCRFTAFDITERKQAEDRIRYMALHDALTNLPNRALLKDRISRDILQAHRYQSVVAVLFIDLDHFKQINDSLGHHIGDQLLQLVAERLVNCVRESDSVARLGGDEFVISLPRLSRGADAALVATKILNTLAHPFTVDGHELHVSGSIGISVYPTDGKDEQVLMRNADAAMYQAKERGRNNYQFFAQQINDQAVHSLALESNLHRAVNRNEFSLHYQPKIDLANGIISGVEALIRWRDRENAFVPPLQFIPIAEKNGLIIPIGEWVLREACRQNRAWQVAGYSPVPVAVNVSAVQFRGKNFLDVVSAILVETGLAPHHLELELTESFLMHDLEFTIPLLKSLKSMGVKLSLDDFGTGYSSLSYLKRFPIDTLKIDQSFIRDIVTESDDAAITSAIISMAKSLKQKVIAEGVETFVQLKFLRERGCDEIQGYYFCKPLSAEEFEQKILQVKIQPWTLPNELYGNK